MTLAAVVWSRTWFLLQKGRSMGRGPSPGNPKVLSKLLDVYRRPPWPFPHLSGAWNLPAPWEWAAMNSCLAVQLCVEGWGNRRTTMKAKIVAPPSAGSWKGPAGSELPAQIETKPGCDWGLSAKSRRSVEVVLAGGVYPNC